MFTSIKLAINGGGGTLEYRRENLTGFSCRISPERVKRGLNPVYLPQETTSDCPFCSERVLSETPTFQDGTRIIRGESTTFPNKFPFAAWHTVTVITHAHAAERFTQKQIADALDAQVESLEGHEGYPSIIWNYLPSAGASLPHPHLQGLVDPVPSCMVSRYLTCGEKYMRATGRLYWGDLQEHERTSSRYLFGDEIAWIAAPVPLGEREVRALLPITHIDELPPLIDAVAEGILTILDFYRSTGTFAFNMGIFFDMSGDDRGFRAFCSLIARMSPNLASASDSSAMERLHFEPLILTSPEDFSASFRSSLLT
jgi:galactose-1-phosphate uridylyltransferase